MLTIKSNAIMCIPKKLKIVEQLIVVAGKETET